MLIDGYSAFSAQADGRQASSAPQSPRSLDARSLLEANPAFDEGSDRDRIVATYAGTGPHRKGPGALGGPAQALRMVHAVDGRQNAPHTRNGMGGNALMGS